MFCALRPRALPRRAAGADRRRCRELLLHRRSRATNRLRAGGANRVSARSALSVHRELHRRSAGRDAEHLFVAIALDAAAAGLNAIDENSLPQVRVLPLDANHENSVPQLRVLHLDANLGSQASPYLACLDDLRPSGFLRHSPAARRRHSAHRRRPLSSMADMAWL